MAAPSWGRGDRAPSKNDTRDGIFLIVGMFRTIIRPGGYSDSDREGEIVEERGGILYELGEKRKEADPGIDMAGEEEITLDSDDMAGDEQATGGGGDTTRRVEDTVDSDGLAGDEQGEDGGEADKRPTLTDSAQDSGSSSGRDSGGSPARPELALSSEGELAEGDTVPPGEGAGEQRRR